MNPHNKSVQVEGRVLRGDELKEYAERSGKCPICGVTQVKRKEGNYLAYRWVDLTVKDERTGRFSVYKGHCIQPTCYTSVDQVRELLGEQVASTHTTRTAVPLPSSTSRGIGMNNDHQSVASGRTTTTKRTFQPAGIFVPPTTAPPPSSTSIPGRSNHHNTTTTAAAAAGVRMQNRRGSEDGGGGPPPTPPSLRTVKTASEITFQPAVVAMGNAAAGIVPPAAGIVPPSPNRYGGGRPVISTATTSAMPSRRSLPGVSRLPLEEETKHEVEQNNDDDVFAVHPDLKTMKELIQDSAYLEFINMMENKCGDVILCRHAYALFGQQLAKDQMARPHAVIVAGENWIKTLFKCLGEHEKDAIVVEQALLCLLTIASLPGTYKRTMVRRAGSIEAFRKILNHHGNSTTIKTLLCTLLVALASNEREGLSAKTKGPVPQLMRQVAGLVTDAPIHQGPDPSCEYAIRALYQLSMHRRVTTVGKTFTQDIRTVFSGDAKLKSLFVHLSHESSIPLLEATVGLLWVLSMPETEEDIEHVSPVWLERDFLIKILNIMQDQLALAYEPSHVLLESCCGLIGNLVVLTPFPDHEYSCQMAQAACAILSKQVLNNTSWNPQEEDEEADTTHLAKSTVHLICNLLSPDDQVDYTRRNFVLQAHPECMDLVMECMKRMPLDQEMQELGCLSIAYSCAEFRQEQKEYLVAKGAISVVGEALRNHASSKQDESMSVDTKEAVLCALASLSGCTSGARKLVEAFIFQQLEALILHEAGNFQRIMHSVIKNCRAGLAGSFGDAGAQASGGGNGLAVLESNPRALAGIAQSLQSQQEAETFFHELTDFVAKPEGSGGNLAEPFAAGGMESVLLAMQRFPQSAVVQKHGCLCLAILFFKFPCPGLDRPITGGAVIHSNLALTTLISIMSDFRPNAGIVEAAGMACLNLLANPVDEFVLTNDGRLTRSLPSLLEMTDAVMGHHSRKKDVLTVYAKVLSMLAPLCSHGELSELSLTIPLLEGIELFADDPQLVESLMGAIESLVRYDSSSANYMASAHGLSVLLSMMTSQTSPEMEIAIASSIVAAILQNPETTIRLTAVSQMVQDSSTLRNLIVGMNRHSRSLDIQENMCSILQSVITLEDMYIRKVIAGEGGVQALCGSLRNHIEESTLVEHAFHAMADLIKSTPMETLHECQDGIWQALTHSFASFVDQEGLISAALDLLVECCEKDDKFSRLLLSEPDSLRDIFHAVKSNLGSSDVQKSGCHVFRHLASNRSTSAVLGQSGGIQAVVNAMLAHLDFTSIQKDGMRAIKNLIALEANKQIFRSVGGEDIIQFSIWAHPRDPQVLAAAFSALNNIMVDPATRSVAAIREPAFESVIGAMRRFPHSLDVQKNACFLLKSCSYLQDNLMLMNRHSDTLFPLLLHAGEVFPNDCGDLCNSIIQRMQRY